MAEAGESKNQCLRCNGRGEEAKPITGACAICGEVTTDHEVIVVPEHIGPPYKEAVKSLLCPLHLKRMRDNEGWQEREREQRAAERKRLNELTYERPMFDPDEGLPPTTEAT